MTASILPLCRRQYFFLSILLLLLFILMILRQSLLITFVLFSFNFLPFVSYACLVSCATLASFVRFVHSVRSVSFIRFVRSLHYLRFVPSVRLLISSCSFPVPFLCCLNYINSFSSVCSITSVIRSFSWRWLQKHDCRGHSWSPTPR